MSNGRRVCKWTCHRPLSVLHVKDTLMYWHALTVFWDILCPQTSCRQFQDVTDMHTNDSACKTRSPSTDSVISVHVWQLETLHFVSCHTRDSYRVTIEPIVDLTDCDLYLEISTTRCQYSSVDIWNKELFVAKLIRDRHSTIYSCIVYIVYTWIHNWQKQMWKKDESELIKQTSIGLHGNYMIREIIVGIYIAQKELLSTVWRNRNSWTTFMETNLNKVANWVSKARRVESTFKLIARRKIIRTSRFVIYWNICSIELYEQFHLLKWSIEIVN